MYKYSIPNVILVLTLAAEHSLPMSRSRQRPLPIDPKIQYKQNACVQAGSIFTVLHTVSQELKLLLSLIFQPKSNENHKYKG